MEPCYYWDNGYGQYLTYEDEGLDLQPQNLANALVALMTELMPVMQPIALLVGVEDCMREFPHDETHSRPATTAYIVEESVPSSISLPKPKASDMRIAITTAMTPSIVADWLQLALKQKAGVETAVITPTILQTYAIRTRLYSVPENSTPIEWPLLLNPGGPVAVSFPIEQRSDGLWIAAPVVDHTTHPAFTLMAQYYSGALEVQLRVHWSWWFEEGFAEFNALKEALQRLVAGGWENRSTRGPNKNDRYHLGNVG